MSTDQSAISPIGTPLSVADERWADESPEYRAQRDARAASREIAWLLIKYRMDHALSQLELAKRVGISSSQIARMESGRHPTSLATLLQVAHALDMKLVLGFERQTSSGEAERELLAL